MDLFKKFVEYLKCISVFLNNSDSLKSKVIFLNNIENFFIIVYIFVINF